LTTTKRQRQYGSGGKPDQDRGPTQKGTQVAGKRMSRRQFVESSVATGLVGLFPSLVDFGEVRTPETGTAPQQLTLRVSGDKENGYGVTIIFQGQPIARHKGGGDFSAVFQNGDRSLEDRVEDWKARSWMGNEVHVTLHGDCTLRNLNTTVSAQVEYEVVTPQVVRKRIQFHQVDIFVLFYQVTNCLKPVDPPVKFWSFDQLDCQGGALHEYFPTAGFRTEAGVTVGLLTDSGYRNRWSRFIRRDGKPLKTAPQLVPDVNLYYVCRNEERKRHQFFVKQTFGEALVQRDNQNAEELMPLPPASRWHKQGDVRVEEHNGTAVLSNWSSEAGVIIPFAAGDDEVYSLQFSYRASQPFSVQVWDVDEQLNQLENIALYNDRIPGSPTEWSEFRTMVFFYSLRGNGGALFISMPQSEQATKQGSSGSALRIALRDLEVGRLRARLQPYHRLEMDRPDQKTSFIFVDDWTPDTLRGYRLSSQLYLADGLNFKGGDTERVLYSDLMMLSWDTSPQYPEPMVAPSVWYSAAGEMYLRDSFFALNGIHNRELNERVFALWAANQGEDGAINTLVEPNLANLERKSNDSTPLWLMWALQNHARFGTKLPMDKVRKAAEYCLRTYDRNRDGTCWAQFVMGQLDVIDYSKGTSEICENQGMFAITLRVIKELRIPGVSNQISEDYIGKAETAYRSYYDPERKSFRPARNITDAIGFGEIFPEFLSLWLFGRKILTDEMLVSHLDRIPNLLPSKNAPYPGAGGTVRPIFIGLRQSGKSWDYFTDTWHPMISKEHGANYVNHNMDGIYYNGGSWMRIEICGYVAGKLHGWGKADEAIANRLWAEINISPDFPTSQEYLATDPAHPFFGYHRVFAWNTFVLQALEMAGVRGPEMDPDYSRPAI
jgi:hypothetical protein